MQEWYEDPHWQHHIRPDTEMAYVTPDRRYPDDADECQCITSAEKEAIQKISAISGITKDDLNGLTAYQSIESSSKYWNDTYQTVSSNSGEWNNTDVKLEDLANNSAKWDNTTTTVSTNSGKWISAYNLTPKVFTNTENINALSAEIAKHLKLYFDTKYSFNGDGTSSAPYSVKDYKEFTDLINKLNTNLEKLFKNGKENWVTLDAQDDINGINPYIKSLIESITLKDVDQDKTLIKHGELIEWLIKNGGGKGPGGKYNAGKGIEISPNNTISVSGYDNIVENSKKGLEAYKYISSNSGTIQYKQITAPETSAELKTYSAKNTIYYSI